MRVELQYGRGELAVELPNGRTDVFAPARASALGDAPAAFRAAVRAPLAGPALRGLIGAGERVAVVISDATRPLPSAQLLGWLFEELSHVLPRNVSVLIGTGSHRASTKHEIEQLLGPWATRCTVVDHDARDRARLKAVGKSRDGRTISFNSAYVDADRRILLGFVEPHFMAGFSGGYKAVFPGLADIEAITHYHRAQVIGDPQSTWGALHENPTQQQVRDNGALLPVDFLINVTLNRAQKITGFFCGEVIAAHEAACAHVAAAAMVKCERRYPIVVTTNAGYPLDQNLYQTVKGLSAAAQIVEPGGLIVAASRCDQGFPDHGNFRRLLISHASPDALLKTILAPGFSLFDQWQAQILANLAKLARLALYSELAPADVRAAFIEPTSDVAERVARELATLGPSARVAVLPEGPMTIPFVSLD